MFSTMFQTWIGSRSCCFVSALAVFMRFLSLSSFLCFLIFNFQDIRLEIVLQYSWLTFFQGFTVFSYTLFGLWDLMRSSRSLFEKYLPFQPRSAPISGTTLDIHPFLSINSPSLPFFRWKATELFNMLTCNLVRSSQSISLCRLQVFLWLAQQNQGCCSWVQMQPWSPMRVQGSLKESGDYQLTPYVWRGKVMIPKGSCTGLPVMTNFRMWPFYIQSIKLNKIVGV